MIGTNLGGFVLELVGGLDLAGPRVGGEFGLGVQLRLGSLLNVGLLGSLYLNVVLGDVVPRGLDSFGFNLGNFVLDSSFNCLIHFYKRA